MSSKEIKSELELDLIKKKICISFITFYITITLNTEKSTG